VGVGLANRLDHPEEETNPVFCEAREGERAETS